MKTMNLIVTIVTITVIIAITACEGKLHSDLELEVYEDEIGTTEVTEKTIDLYQNFKQYIANRDPNSLQQITSFLFEYKENEIFTTKNAEDKIDVLNNYLLVNGIEESQLHVFLEENPDEMMNIIELICTSEFINYYSQIKYLPLTEENIFVSQIYNELQLTHLQKTMLFLLLSSENDIDSQTRSLISCIKRYAKLTAITVKAIAISTVDAAAGAEYASKELKSMGSEYDC